MIKAVIFDLNGVFIQSPKLSLAYAAKFGVPAAEFMAALLESEGKFRPANTRDVYAYWQPYLKEWGITMEKDEFLEFWFGAEGGNHDMVILARQLKDRGKKVLLHSNNLRERAEYYRTNFPFLTSLFDRVYYSWETGYLKPDPRGLAHILRESQLQPEECVYVDDTRENIAAAREIGMTALQYEGVDPLYQSLRKLGVF